MVARALPMGSCLGGRGACKPRPFAAGSSAGGEGCMGPRTGARAVSARRAACSAGVHEEPRLLSRRLAWLSVRLAAGAVLGPVLVAEAAGIVPCTGEGRAGEQGGEVRDCASGQRGRAVFSACTQVASLDMRAQGADRAADGLLCSLGPTGHWQHVNAAALTVLDAPLLARQEVDAGVVCMG